MIGKRITFELDVEVYFSDENAAKSHLIDGDWKNVFFDFQSMRELSAHIAYVFYITPNTHRKGMKGEVKLTRFIEGFGYFEKQENGGWLLKDLSETVGDILIKSDMQLLEQSAITISLD